ncbi:MAG TPA: hypothetical protein VIL84_07855 [Devosiaceae bacterium]
MTHFDIKKGSDGGTHPTIGLTTGNAGKYKPSAFMLYRINNRTYMTNTVSTKITVH